MKESKTGKSSKLQEVNVAPESVLFQLDKHKVSFRKLNEILKHKGVDLRTYFDEASFFPAFFVIFLYYRI